MYVERDPTLLMFFYGTLKRGHRNHDLFCRGARRVEEATVRGALYDLPFGYPALVVPEEDILAVGSASPARDTEERRRLGHRMAHRTDGPQVFGELFAFNDPEERLPAIDRLEGFDPREGSGPYRRVLLPVQTASNVLVPAWAYVVETASGVHLPGGRWPS